MHSSGYWYAFYFHKKPLIIEARSLGFKRIGVGKTFIHLGIDESKSQFVVWGYPSGSRPDVNLFVRNFLCKLIK